MDRRKGNSPVHCVCVESSTVGAFNIFGKHRMFLRFERERQDEYGLIGV